MDTRMPVVETSFWMAFERRAVAAGAAPLVVDGLSGVALSWAQVRAQAEGLAAWLSAQGVTPGAVVSWQLPTGLPSFVLQLALARIGAVQSPMISVYGAAETLAVLRRNQPAFHVVLDGDLTGLDRQAPALLAQMQQPAKLLCLGEPLPQADPSDLPPPPADHHTVRWLYATSGTSSEPKGVRHTDESVLRAGRNLALAMEAQPEDVGTIAYPIAHIGGAMYTAMLAASGASVVLLPRFQIAEAVQVFARHGVSLSGGSTAHYQAFLGEQGRSPGPLLMPRLRLLAGGGAPKPPDLVARVQAELGCVLAHAYGMTEAPLVSAGRVDDTPEQLAWSDGAVCDAFEVRLTDAEGRTVATGTEGEIRLRGPGLFKGYTDPALNAQAFDEDGWFRTGDLGRLRPDGHLAVTGRLKDIIIRKGENISAREVEDVLSRHPKVGAVAVIGLPDAERGERVCAVVELRQAGDRLSFAEMVDWFISAQVMRQKIPEQLEVVDTLPRLASLNKVSKAALRERFAHPPRPLPFN